MERSELTKHHADNLEVLPSAIEDLQRRVEDAEVENIDGMAEAGLLVTLAAPVVATVAASGSSSELETSIMP